MKIAKQDRAIVYVACALLGVGAVLYAWPKIKAKMAASKAPPQVPAGRAPSYGGSPYGGPTPPQMPAGSDDSPSPGDAWSSDRGTSTDATAQGYADTYAAQGGDAFGHSSGGPSTGQAYGS